MLAGGTVVDYEDVKGLLVGGAASGLMAGHSLPTTPKSEQKLRPGPVRGRGLRRRRDGRGSRRRRAMPARRHLRLRRERASCDRDHVHDGLDDLGRREPLGHPVRRGPPVYIPHQRNRNPRP